MTTSAKLVNSRADAIHPNENIRTLFQRVVIFFRSGRAMKTFGSVLDPGFFTNHSDDRAALFNKKRYPPCHIPKFKKIPILELGHRSVVLGGD